MHGAADTTAPDHQKCLEEVAPQGYQLPAMEAVPPQQQPYSDAMFMNMQMTSQQAASSSSSSSATTATTTTVLGGTPAGYRDGVIMRLLAEKRELAGLVQRETELVSENNALRTVIDQLVASLAAAQQLLDELASTTTVTAATASRRGDGAGDDADAVGGVHGASSNREMALEGHVKRLTDEIRVRTHTHKHTPTRSAHRCLLQAKDVTTANLLVELAQLRGAMVAGGGSMLSASDSGPLPFEIAAVGYSGNEASRFTTHHGGGNGNSRHVPMSMPTSMPMPTQSSRRRHRRPRQRSGGGGGGARGAGTNGSSSRHKPMVVPHSPGPGSGSTSSSSTSPSSGRRRVQAGGAAGSGQRKEEDAARLRHLSLSDALLAMESSVAGYERKHSVYPLSPPAEAVSSSDERELGLGRDRDRERGGYFHSTGGDQLAGAGAGAGAAAATARTRGASSTTGATSTSAFRSPSRGPSRSSPMFDSPSSSPSSWAGHPSDMETASANTQPERPTPSPPQATLGRSGYSGHGIADGWHRSSREQMSHLGGSPTTM